MKHRPVAEQVGSTLIGLALSLGTGGAAADVVAVVSPRNPLTTLSKNEAVDIFLGKANQFPGGGRAAPVDQAEGSAARDEFYTRFAGKSPPQLKAYWSKIIFTGRGQPPREAGGGAEVKKLVGANPDAIGYIERNQVDGSVKVLPLSE
jgi:ABC-type phosphate transport system substrate-binding protein